MLMSSNCLLVGPWFDERTTRQSTLHVSLVDVAMRGVLALKNVQMQTWTRVGYFGNILTIDHSWYISNLPKSRFKHDIQRRGRKDQGLYVGYRVMQAINRPASLSYQHSLSKVKENLPPCIATANQYVSLHEVYVANIPANNLP
jgi:hypothetical protein